MAAASSEESGSAGKDRAESDPGAELAPDPFWDFSSRVYGAPAVAEALLSLQDRRGLDVNLLLLCLWCGCGGRALSLADIARLEALVDPWRRTVVERLRALRRQLKADPPLTGPGSALLRQKVLDCEIFAEAIVQRSLHGAVGDVPAGPVADPACALGNLRAYLDFAGVRAARRDVGELGVILRAVWPQLREADLCTEFPA